MDTSRNRRHWMGKSRGTTQYPSVKFQNDSAKTYLEEDKRLTKNKMTLFKFCVEEELLTETIRAEYQRWCKR